MDLAPFMEIILQFILLFFLLFVAIYIYQAMALMTVAKRLGEKKDAWFAWIPILNLVLMAKLAKMPWWPVIFFLVGFIPWVGFLFSIAGMVFMTIWVWRICEARGKPGWWAVLAVIPIIGWVWSFVMWGILAWSKDETPSPKASAPKKSPKRRKVRK